MRRVLGVIASRASPFNRPSLILRARPVVTIQHFSNEAAQDPKPEPTAQELAPAPAEEIVGDPVKHEFQAETRKLLRIVAQSLYTEREIFVRELISNASDALSKLKYKQSVGEEIADAVLPLEITITGDEKNNTLTLQDSGVGMTDKELIKNLGTIAHSGTQTFMQETKDGAKADLNHIIGQFGVGFYSAFMVANKVEVYSKSAAPGAQGYKWSSDGTGAYEIVQCNNVARGTKIVLYLNKDSKEFADIQNLEHIIKKHSNFVSFDIKLNGRKINTVEAIWSKDPKSISEETHKEFYKFISHAYDEPQYRLHFKTDSPLNLQALFYSPKSHFEKYGMGQMEPGVSLFCRKVLIQRNMKGLLPDWLRFLKGVVDCEDIPLNLSREHLQDSQLVKQLGQVLTRRVLKWLLSEASADSEKYNKYFDEFGRFFKEGVVTGSDHQEELAKLLRYETSAKPTGTVISLDEYMDRIKAGQDKIYYLVAPKRSFHESSPYYEAYKKRDIEVLFLYQPMDDFVMHQLKSYKGKSIVSVETASVDFAEEDANKVEPKLTKEEVQTFSKWIKKVLDDRVSIVRPSVRLVDSPAIVVDDQTASFRRMMKFADPRNAPLLPKQELEYNPTHPLMIAIFEKKDINPELASVILEQVFDNALVAAGLMDDSRVMLPRLNKIMQNLMGISSSTASKSAAPQTDKLPVPEIKNEPPVEPAKQS